MPLPRSVAPAPRVARHLRIESFLERHARLLFPIPFLLLTALLCAPFFFTRYPSYPPNRAEADVGMLEFAATLHCVEMPSAPCATVERLQADGYVDPSRELRDPWGASYRSVCVPGTCGARFFSSGPDEVFGNADDISR